MIYLVGLFDSSACVAFEFIVVRWVEEFGCGDEQWVGVANVVQRLGPFVLIKFFLVGDGVDDSYLLVFRLCVSVVC